MLTDTSLLPGFDDKAPLDDSGGERKENRPGMQDLSDEMESENGTESNKHIFAPDAGNINNNGDKYGDFAQKMIAIAKRKRAAANDGWKQHENVPPAGIHGEIKKSDSGIAVREGKEFRLRDEMVIESREITQQEAPRKQAVKQDGLDKYYESNWVSGLALEGAARALRSARIQNPTIRCVLMLMAENAHNDFGVYECALAQSLMAKILGVKQCTVSRAIKALVDAKLIRPASSFVPGRKSICYELLFAIRGGEK